AFGLLPVRPHGRPRRAVAGELLDRHPYRVLTQSVHLMSGWARRAIWAASYSARLSARKLIVTETKRPALEAREGRVSIMMVRAAPASSRGITCSGCASAGPMAVISNTPGKLKPLACGSSLIGIVSGLDHGFPK